MSSTSRRQEEEILHCGGHVDWRHMIILRCTSTICSSCKVTARPEMIVYDCILQQTSQSTWTPVSSLYLATSAAIIWIEQMGISNGIYINKKTK